MNLDIWYERVVRYYQKHGAVGVFKRFFQKIMEILSPRPDVVYYVDLLHLDSPKHDLPSDWRIVERKSREEMSEQEVETLCSQLGRKAILKHLKERFEMGSSLWLAYVGNQLAGMIWSEVGSTMNPYYLLLAPKDVHLYDNYVFEHFRGKGINPILVETVIWLLKKQEFWRVYGETKWRNVSERRSLSKTSFAILGTASTRWFLKKMLVVWHLGYDPHVLPVRK